MKNKKKIIFKFFALLFIFLIGCILYLLISLSPVDTDENLVSFTVTQGTSKTDIIDDLYEAGIIRNSLALKIYLVLNLNEDLMAGDYVFDTSSSAVDILIQLQKGEYEITEKETVSVTFIEGKRLTDYAYVISENFDYSYDEVVAVMNDVDFLEELISKYSMITNEILDEDIYYPLEGYLFPETYEFYTDASLYEIIDKLVSQTNTVFSTYIDIVNESDYTVHELITMASITELEANSYEDRQSVAQVIYTRIDLGMTLGMDVTSYYGVQKSMSEELTASDLADLNAYNTRLSTLLGLPVGAICNPSLESIKAVLYPDDGDYVYFYADEETGEVSFFSLYSDFLAFKNSR